MIRVDKNALRGVSKLGERGGNRKEAYVLRAGKRNRGRNKTPQNGRKNREKKDKPTYFRLPKPEGNPKRVRTSIHVLYHLVNVLQIEKEEQARGGG